MAKYETEYRIKFEKLKENQLFESLPTDQKLFLKEIAFQLRLTYQEFKFVVEAARDMEMWHEKDFKSWWLENIDNDVTYEKNSKNTILPKLKKYLHDLRTNPTVYSKEGLPKPVLRESKKIVVEKSDKEIYGMCPVASPKTVCCNLRTIDAVENCAFGCSYCTIQTFYTEKAVFDADLKEKLDAIKIEPNRFYRFGSGQSSDSLSWGNRNGILDALCQFAEKHPNILIELKTKSNNISYFLENKTPPNIVCSFSLNTDTIVNNEEHFTASLHKRIQAAKELVDRGIKVAFHFHPMVYYKGWDIDYPAIAEQLIQDFDVNDVLFVSFGSVTLIKPVIQKIRKLGNPTKTLQMDLLPDPHGKLTYSDDIKNMMFSKMYETFKPWLDKVFIYLCMEKAEIWKNSFGYVYNSNEEFEIDFGKKTMSKLTIEC